MVKAFLRPSKLQDFEVSQGSSGLQIPKFFRDSQSFRISRFLDVSGLQCFRISQDFPVFRGASEFHKFSHAFFGFLSVSLPLFFRFTYLCGSREYTTLTHNRLTVTKSSRNSAGICDSPSIVQRDECPKRFEENMLLVRKLSVTLR